MQGISDLITILGEVNVDFADVRTIITGMGMALMGTGIAKGEHRALEAAQRAISSPLLEETSIQGARGVLINISGGSDAVDPDANIISGMVIDPTLDEAMKVTVIATGFDRNGEERPRTPMPQININRPTQAPNLAALPQRPRAPGPVRAGPRRAREVHRRRALLPQGHRQRPRG